MRRYCNYCGCEQEFQELAGDKYAVLWENSHAELWENSHAELRENSHAELWENSHAVLWGNSHAVLRENSHAELRENSHAVLWGNSHAVLRENSHAELRENSHAVLRENSHAQCQSPYACGILKSIAAKCTCRQVGDKPISAKEYLASCGIQIKNQYAILFKSVKANFSSFRTSEIEYIIGKETIAPDWDADAKVECGKGLHLSPSVKQAISFGDDKTYLACRVKIKDIASLPAFAEYPDKIRVRACTPLYQVDIDGNKMEVELCRR